MYNGTAGAPMAGAFVNREPQLSLRGVLREDLLARYPEATHWNGWRTAVRFLSDPSLQAVLTLRLVLRSRGRLLFLWRTWTIAKYRIDVFRCEIGPGLHLPHPFGVILARGTKLGSNVTIYHGVTIGFARAPRPGQRLPSPEVGDRVVIGPGSLVAGPICIGSDSRLAPRAFVDRDVPPGSVVEAAGPG